MDINSTESAYAGACVQDANQIGSLSNDRVVFLLLLTDDRAALHNAGVMVGPFEDDMTWDVNFDRVGANSRPAES